jgi:hypothetical protein
MDIGRSVVGLIMIAVAFWAFFTLTNTAAQYIGGAALFILGIALIVTSIIRKK